MLCRPVTHLKYCVVTPALLSQILINAQPKCVLQDSLSDKENPSRLKKIVDNLVRHSQELRVITSKFVQALKG